MKNNIKIDWFDKLKIETIQIALFSQQIRKRTIFMLRTHRWVLEDINLCESFSHLQEMIGVSNHDLDQFVQEIYTLDNGTALFNKDDLLDEFAYIKENICLESDFLTNMVNYITIIINPNINDLSIVERLEQYREIDISCYNQMKINNKELKQLKHERRD